MAARATYPDLKGQTVLVTGGASGIGESIVRHFSSQGSKVGFIDLDADAGTALANELADSAGVSFQVCDLRDVDALRKAVAAIRQALGPITILINNAARDDRHAIDDVTSDYWDDRIGTNLKHQFFAAQAVYPDMAAAGGGSIINMGSTSWMLGQGGMPCYTTAKSAVQGLTRSLARDFGPMNIRVNSVLPGWIMTPRQIEMWLTPESEAGLMERQCLKRKLVPEDIARAVLFFASDEASTCTNQSYIVDGGWL